MPNAIAINYVKAGDQPNACEIYRANMPLYFLSQNGWGVRWAYMDEILTDYHKRGIRAFLDLVSTFDIFVLPRMVAPNEAYMNSISAFFELLRKFDKRIVYEIDDDYTNAHRDFSAHGIKHAMLIASWTDACTVTTPYLADLMRKHTQRPTYILPNCIDPVAWDHPEKHIEKPQLVIGLSGSPTHYEDWKVLETVMPRILQNEYDVDVRFRLTAFHPDYLKDLPKTDYLPAFDYAGYVELVRSCDIILAPLDLKDQFNMGKSPIKVIEGMGATRPLNGRKAGAFCIATKHPVYELAIRDGVNGLLAEQTPESWYEAIDRAIRDQELRHRIQTACHKWVWKHHDISRVWRKWAVAYRHILQAPANPILPAVA